MTSPFNLTRWTAGQMKRYDGATNDNGARPKSDGIGFERDYEGCFKSDGMRDLSDATPVFTGRTGAFQRLRGVEFKKGTWEQTRRDGTRYAYQRDGGRTFKQQRESRVHWHTTLACPPLHEECRLLSAMATSPHDIRPDILRFLIGGDMTRLARLHAYGVMYLRQWSTKSQTNVSHQLAAIVVDDALVRLFWPGAKRHLDRTRERKSDRPAPPSIKERSIYFGMRGQAYFQMRCVVVDMFRRRYDEGFEEWIRKDVGVNHSRERDIEIPEGIRKRSVSDRSIPRMAA